MARPVEEAIQTMQSFDQPIIRELHLTDTHNIGLGITYNE